MQDTPSRPRYSLDMQVGASEYPEQPAACCRLERLRDVVRDEHRARQQGLEYSCTLPLLCMLHATAAQRAKQFDSARVQHYDCAGAATRGASTNTQYEPRSYPHATREGATHKVDRPARLCNKAAIALPHTPTCPCTGSTSASPRSTCTGVVLPIRSVGRRSCGWLGSVERAR